MSNTQKSSLQSIKFWFIILAIIIGIIFALRVFITLFIHKQPIIPPAPVAVASVKTKNVPVYYSGLGTVTADYIITVKTQISGILTHVYFNDGQTVKTGEVLAKIDSRPYEAQLLQAEGQLIRDKALLKNALIDLKRYVNLYQSRAVSQQTLDTQQSLVKQNEGTVKIDQGLVDAAKTNMAYCKIISPVSGRIGIDLVTEGNFVQPSDATGIAIITTLNPISILFPLPEDDVSAVEKQFNAGKKLTVDAYNRDQQKLLAVGTLSAIDNQVNVSTGTVQFKAQFNNQNNTLFPNQFVNINLKVTTLKNALIIPTTAVQEGAQGSYVYRYNTNHTVSMVPVKTGVVDGNNTVIMNGLSVNQMVVTVGADKLFDGARVTIS